MNCEKCGDVLTEKDELEHSIVSDESYGVAGSPAEIIFLCEDCFYWARVDDGEDNIPIVRDNKERVSEVKDNNAVEQLTGTCVLCGGAYTGWGNNPEPVVKFEDGRACDTCNQTKVIPARLTRYRAVEQVLAESEKQNDV